MSSIDSRKPNSGEPNSGEPSSGEPSSGEPSSGEPNSREPNSKKLDRREFRNALGTFATGVTAITARDTNGEPVGITANSFASVSLDPPLVLWSLGKASNTYPVFSSVSHFAIHVLTQEQQRISQMFASSDGDKFAGLTLERGVANLPLLDRFCARFQCEVVERHPGGDHLILVARVLAMDYSEQEPLVFQGGEYRKIR